MSDPENYTVGWICAITTEYVAAQAFLDEAHEGPEYVSPGDTNGYALGRIGKHNVVIAVLPKGEYGIAAAAGVAKDMGHSFPNVRIGLMVGIGGGAPSPKHDIRLGDIVVSAPQAQHGGVFQYDFGKTIQDQVFQETGCLNQPPTVLLTAVSAIEAQYELDGHQLEEEVNNAIQKKPRLRKKYSRPDPSTDRLYKSKFIHTPINAADCDKCRADPSGLVERPERDEDENNSVVHYGIIASGSQLMKDALIRDKFAAEKGILCFEMEAAGLMNRFPCMVIRGICDYSDSHKNKEWQGYAAMVAAAYAKDLLRQIVPNRIEMTKKISDILSDMEGGQKQIAESVRRVGQDINLAKLQLASGAAYHSHDNESESLCHPGTRASVLQHIYEWTEDRDGKCIYWLQGMAGTGKSTICRTVAHELDKRGMLGASFFFKRGEGDRGKAARFFPTIADQLAHRHPCLAPHVLKAVEADRSITEKALNMQFRDLLLQPLRGIETNPEAPGLTVVVVDALDECDRERDAQTIIALLPQLKQLASSRVKIFVTSRPEFPIRLEFDRISGSYQDLVLHQVDERVIHDDILNFLTAELSAIRDEYNSLLPKNRRLSLDWPDQRDVQRLAEIAVPLFIFAATARRFIGERKLGPPDKQLGKILEYQTREMSKLDATYLPVLDQLVVGLNEIAKDNVIRVFQEVVGSIVVLATPLSTASMSSLLGMDRQIIETELDLLHSVLDVPSDPGDPVKLLHLSFRDFLVADKTHRFQVDEKITNERLLASCLDLLMNNGCLKEDICDLKMPGTLQENVSWSTINRCLSSDVQYACLYWVYHLKEGNVRLGDEHQAFRFLKRHFLHWFEALSLMGRTSEGILMIDQLQSQVNTSNGAEASRFLHDAKRFMLNCQSGVQQSPLQLYSSALLFAPGRSVLRKAFQEHVSWIKMMPNREDDWDTCLQVLDGHVGQVTSVTFSNDGRLIASGSKDNTVKVWDAATGALQCVLQSVGEGHLGLKHNVSSLAFSSDDRQLASGLFGGKIKVWDVASGVFQCNLEGHPGKVTTMTFLNNWPSKAGCLSSNTCLASGSVDGSIKIWDALAGELQCTLEIQPYGVSSLAFSRDSMQLVSVFDDGYMAFWDTTPAITKSTPAKVHGRGSRKRYSTTLLGCQVTSIMLSKDGRKVATGFKNGEADIFDTATGVYRCTFRKPPLRGKVSSIEFSSNGRKVAMSHEPHDESVPRDLEGITVWDAATGELQCTVKASVFPGERVASAFSNCGKQLVVGGVGKIKVWGVETGAPQHISERGDEVREVMFSRSGPWLVTRSHSGTHSLWDHTTGTLQYILEDVSKITVSSGLNVAFSSNGRLLASISHGGEINICEVATGRLQRTLKSPRGPVKSVAFSRNGQLAAGLLDGTVEIWDVTWTLQHTFGGARGGRPGAVAFSPDGWRLASRSSEQTIKIWDPVTGALERVIKWESSVTSFVFSKDGARLASRDTGVVYVWDVATGALPWIMGGAGGGGFGKLPAMSFDATGSYFLSGAHAIPQRLTRNLHGLEVVSGLGIYNNFQPHPESQAESSSRRAGEQPFRGYHLAFDRKWIQWKGQNIMWIPPTRRPRFSDLSPGYTTIAFSSESGELIVLGFPAEGPPGCQ